MIMELLCMSRQYCHQTIWVLKWKPQCKAQNTSLQIIDPVFPKDLPNNIGYYHCFGLPIILHVKAFFIAENITHFGCRTLRNQPQSSQEVSSMLDCFHSTWSCYLGSWGRGGGEHKDLTQCWTLSFVISHLPGRMCPLVHWQDNC